MNKFCAISIIKLWDVKFVMNYSYIIQILDKLCEFHYTSSSFAITLNKLREYFQFMVCKSRFSIKEHVWLECRDPSVVIIWKRANCVVEISILL